MEREMLGELRKGIEKEQYQPYNEALDFVRENQPFDPSDPDPRFANDLHATIADALRLKDYKHLEFYTAVGSNLDQFHGVDAFIEWHTDPENNPKAVQRVTLDITINPQKGESYKADVLIYVPSEGLDPKEDREEFAELVNNTAEEILEKLSHQSKT